MSQQIEALRQAILDKGPAPLRHDQIMAKHRAEWPTLWAAIDDLLAPTIADTELELATAEYPDHHPYTALANYRAGREVWDTNGDLW